MTSGPSAPAARRSADLDLFKTILTIGMIFAHVVQLADFTPGRVEQDLSLYANLVTFSGFMLAFGLGVGRSERSTGKTLVAKVRAPLTLYAAYSLSSVAFIVLVERRGIDAKTLVDLLVMRRLHGYSEFLASFFLLSVVTTLFRGQVVALGRSFWAPPLAALVGVAACAFAPTAVDWPFVGALFGTAAFPTFPLPQYGFWFVAGLHAARGGQWQALWCGLLAAAATAAFCLVWRDSGMLPARFPPSALWVFGAAFPLTVTLWLVRLIARRTALPDWTLMPGRHVLFFLVASNVALFANRFVNGKSFLNLAEVTAATVLLIGMIGVLRFAWDKALGRLQANPGK